MAKKHEPKKIKDIHKSYEVSEDVKDRIIWTKLVLILVPAVIYMICLFCLDTEDKDALILKV